MFRYTQLEQNVVNPAALCDLPHDLKQDCNYTDNFQSFSLSLSVILMSRADFCFVSV